MTPNKGDKQTRMLSPLITPNKGYKQTRVQSWRNTTVIYLRPEFSLHLFTFHIAQCLSSVKKDAVDGVCVPEIAPRAFSTLGQLDVVCRILHPQFWLLSVAFLELLPPCADPDFVAPTPLQHQQCCPPPKKEKTKSIATQFSKEKVKTVARAHPTPTPTICATPLTVVKLSEWWLSIEHARLLLLKWLWLWMGHTWVLLLN